ncbi:MAG: hypothetical protein HY877_01930 [Deltaproteobacteria bacterium]|nr:hypothetical protein [Deltaproteobacteria bacterium]
MAGLIRANPQLYMQAVQRRSPTITPQPDALRFAKDPGTFLRLLNPPGKSVSTTISSPTPASAEAVSGEPARVTSPASLIRKQLSYLGAVLQTLTAVLAYPSVVEISDEREDKFFLRVVQESLKQFLGETTHTPVEMETRVNSVVTQIADERILLLSRQANISLPVWVPPKPQPPRAKPVARPAITEETLRDVVKSYMTDEARITNFLQNYRYAVKKHRITERGKRSLAVALQGEENFPMVEALLTVSAADSFGIILDTINDTEQLEQAVEADNTPILVWNTADDSPKTNRLLDQRISRASTAQILGSRKPLTLIVIGIIPTESFRNNFFERHSEGNIIVVGGKYFTHFYRDTSLSPRQPREMKVRINRVSGEEE